MGRGSTFAGREGGDRIVAGGRDSRDTATIPAPTEQRVAGFRDPCPTIQSDLS